LSSGLRQGEPYRKNELLKGLSRQSKFG
jgi:hypothetical protein